MRALARKAYGIGAAALPHHVQTPARARNVTGAWCSAGMVVGLVIDLVHHPLHSIPEICAGFGGLMQVLWLHVQLMPFAHAGMIAGLLASLVLHLTCHGTSVPACISKAGVKCLGMAAVVAICLRVFETASPQGMMAAMAVGFVSMDLGKAVLPGQASWLGARRSYGIVNGGNAVIP